MDFFQELAAMIGNAPLREISERLYYLTHRIWLKSVPHLNLTDEITVFRREVADILAAMELGDLEERRPYPPQPHLHEREAHAKNIRQGPLMKANPISATVDFERDGMQHGFLRLPYSRDDPPGAR